ncbi:hypothetical protein J2W57_001529 [Chryseobacterium ginsenosidimutans]|uniref:Uncharacterized protein n=1 Tax=Chryseobacterium geocarposphaerae TaxID=1416776 RepID=A0ABU1LD04_9FLAO|nr:hypothetical protein [Chryseobacterium geocarposphaerae]MDR6698161.1 hypothetical protein [Chryseobacterium ginsenosidimutans]
MFLFELNVKYKGDVIKSKKIASISEGYILDQIKFIEFFFT